jgi:hypothetical protein
MSLPCGCCSAINLPTPRPIRNRPGLPALVYRVGTYADFLETMRSRLSGADLPALSGLLTRDANDPSIALLDAWAVVADVLTFYQERIANEGYLRTATERQSVQYLAQLVGYDLRPGVASSVFLAYVLDQNSTASVPAGSQAQTIPGQDQLPQTYETQTDLSAQGALNTLTPRQTQPQIISADTPEMYIDGISANLKPNDPMLVVASPPQLKYVAAVDVQFTQSRTKVTFQSSISSSAAPPILPSPLAAAVAVAAPLSIPPADHPADPARLPRSIANTFSQQADMIPAVIQALKPQAGSQLYTALKNATVAPEPGGELHAFRVRATPFGSTAPLKPVTDDKGVVIGTEEWPLVGRVEISIVIVPEGELARGAEALVLEGRVGQGGRLRIVLGSDSAATTFSLSRPDQVLTVGKWSVRIRQNMDRTAPTVEFDFQPPLSHSIKVTTRERRQLLEVTADTLPAPIDVPQGQIVSTSSGGNQVSVSFGTDISITDKSPIAPDQLNVLQLDAVYDQIIPGTWVAITRTGATPLITRVQDAQDVSVARYGLTSRVTQLTLNDPWLDPAQDRMLTVARQTSVAAQSEQLTLGEEPIQDDVVGNEIELGDIYDGLQSGRWFIVQGERTDIPNTSGVKGTELVMLDGAQQKVRQITLPPPAVPPTALAAVAPPPPPPPVNRPGDTTHTFLRMSSHLAYTYKRDSVTVYGNVVRATHGATTTEILGSGDGSARQQFNLRTSPLTYLPAPTAKGSQSTLQVFVNDVPWQEVGSLSGAGPSDRVYITSTNGSATTVIFGDGIHGMRPPSGRQNVRAIYRTGIGTAGEADASQVSLPVSRPLGVTTVVNPLPASKAADPETRDQGRRNAPLGAAALDRLVSIQDYADFARTYAGIGKATATRLSDGHRQIVYVTFAGTEDAPIDKSSDVFLNLVTAFEELGDPHLPILVDSREAMLLVIGAAVQTLPDYQFESVVAQVRSELLDAFSFDRRDFGQSVPLSEVISHIQGVPGVSYVEVTTLDGISESDTETPDALQAKLAAIVSGGPPKSRVNVRPARLDPATKTLRPAQVAYLNPNLPDTLILTEAVE